MPTLVSICVCTYRRPTLARTLESIGRQALPGSIAVEVIVVDNDASGSARAIVEEAAANIPCPVRYAIEPNKGLSRARNKTLELARGEWLALIDDDEVAETNWLDELFACATKFDADAVIGNVYPTFQMQPPRWLAGSRLYDYPLPASGTRVSQGEALSGNTLIRARFLRDHGLRFDAAYDTTGGEDSDFFRCFLDSGGIVVSAPGAVVQEIIPPERMSWRYVLQRSLRAGEIYARVSHRHGGPKAAAKGIMRAGLNVLACTALTGACTIAGNGARYRYFLLLVRNLGKFRYYCGLRPIEMYK